MIGKSLALRIFESSYIQRWNDKIRPVELAELDKNSHKMIIAYCLGKYEEAAGRHVDWNAIIRGDGARVVDKSKEKEKPQGVLKIGAAPFCCGLIG